MFDWLNVNGVAVQAITTAVRVGITGYYAWQTKEQAKAARAATEEMRQTREAQARAYVNLEIWPWERRYRMFDLAICNYGAGAARDIRVEFDPDVSQPQYAGGTMNDLELMRNLPFLAPNDEVVLFLGLRDWIMAEDLPDRWTGVVSYSDAAGRHETGFEINRRPF